MTLDFVLDGLGAGLGAAAAAHGTSPKEAMSSSSDGADLDRAAGADERQKLTSCREHKRASTKSCFRSFKELTHLVLVAQNVKLCSKDGCFPLSLFACKLLLDNVAMPKADGTRLFFLNFVAFLSPKKTSFRRFRSVALVNVDSQAGLN